MENKNNQEPTLAELKEELKLNRLILLELFGYVNNLHFSLVPYHNSVAVSFIFKRLFEHSGLTEADIEKVFGGLHEDYVANFQELLAHLRGMGADTEWPEKQIKNCEINRIKDPLSYVLT